MHVDVTTWTEEELQSHIGYRCDIISAGPGDYLKPPHGAVAAVIVAGESGGYLSRGTGMVYPTTGKDIMVDIQPDVICFAHKIAVKWVVKT